MDKPNRFDKSGPAVELRAQRDLLWKVLKHAMGNARFREKWCACSGCAEVRAALFEAYGAPDAPPRVQS